MEIKFGYKGTSNNKLEKAEFIYSKHPIREVTGDRMS